MFLSHTFNGAFGLNIGDLSLKLVQLHAAPTIRGQQRFVAKEIRLVPLPPGLVVNGEIEQPELVRRKLLQILGHEGSLYKPLRAKWAVVDLPEPKSFLKLITIDAPADTLTDDDVAFQARKHLPFDLEETYLDWQVMDTEPGRSSSTRVLIGAIHKVIADSYTYLLESADINPLALEVEAMAVTRSLITRSKTYVGEARALLDLGATRSSLIIYDHDTIQFSTTLPFSGELLTTALMQQLKLDYATAEKLKVKNGFNHIAEYPRYLKTMSDLALTLMDHITKTLAFYKEHFPDTNPITHITMCGGVAALPNLSSVIASKLKISAQPGNAWKNIAPSAMADYDRLRGLTFASALGLALRAAENPLSESL
jgi:type IV pilus assembly protein PilM